jgi:hypothetical protein
VSWTLTTSALQSTPATPPRRRRRRSRCLTEHRLARKHTVSLTPSTLTISKIERTNEHHE